MEENIYAAVDRYIRERLGQENEALIHARQSIQQYQLPDASVSANQGKFLSVMVKCCGAKRILELGTFCAYSTIWMAQALPADGKIVSIEADPLHAAIARENIAFAGLSDKIEVRHGDAFEILEQLEAEKQHPFDMFFIDADKPPYAEYMLWTRRLGRVGALVIADNVIRNAQVLDKSSVDVKVKGVQRLNDMLADSADFTATILQQVGIKEHDGMVIALING